MFDEIQLNVTSREIVCIIMALEDFVCNAGSSTFDFQIEESKLIQNLLDREIYPKFERDLDWSEVN